MAPPWGVWRHQNPHRVVVERGYEEGDEDGNGKNMKMQIKIEDEKKMVKNHQQKKLKWTYIVYCCFP